MMHASAHSAPAQERSRALVRLILGQLQVIGATITLVFLLRGGASSGVICSLVLTGMISVTSILLFRVIWKTRPKV